jgi:hypothetical protein
MEETMYKDYYEKERELLVSRLEKMSHIKGGEAVLLLMDHPNYPIPYHFIMNMPVIRGKHGYKHRSTGTGIVELIDQIGFEFSNEINFSNELALASSAFLCNSPILIIEENGIKLVKRHLNALITKLEKLRENSIWDEYTRIKEEEILLEIAEIRNFFKKTITKSGRIRTIKNNMNDIKRSVVANVKNFFDELRLLDEQLANDISKKLRYDEQTMTYVI